MPIGRIVLKSISKSKKLSKDITPEDSACLLFTWLIPHLDVNGCYHADPRIVNGTVWPRRGHTDEFTAQCLEQISKSGLILLYENNGDHFLCVPDFILKQPNINPDREGTPSIPPPTHEQLMTNPAINHELLQHKLSKVKLSKPSSDKTPTEDMFKVFSDLYAKEHGEKPRFIKGKDGAIAKTLWTWCKEAKPDDPMGYYRARVERIWRIRPDIRSYGGVQLFWNWGVEDKPKKKHPMMDA